MHTTGELTEIRKDRLGSDGWRGRRQDGVPGRAKRLWVGRNNVPPEKLKCSKGSWGPDKDGKKDLR